MKRVVDAFDAAGVWRYDANKTGKVFSPKERYATGIRNGEGFDFDTAGRLYVTQHLSCMRTALYGRATLPLCAEG